MQPRRRLNAGRQRHTDVQSESVQPIPGAHEGGGIDAKKTVFNWRFSIEGVPSLSVQ